MTSPLSKVLMPLAIISLSACATAPSQTPLMAGIDKSAIGTPVPGGLRAASDPVCVNLYQNMASYVPEPPKPNKGGRFLQAMAINVLASAATGGVVSGIGSNVGRYAAGAAMGTATGTAGNAALNSMNKPTDIQVQKEQAAKAVSCPMPAAPSKQIDT